MIFVVIVLVGVVCAHTTMENVCHWIRESIMPRSQLAFWDFLSDQLDGDVIVAGSFAAAQMEHNAYDSHRGYNNINIWYNEPDGIPLCHDQLTALACTCYVSLFCLLCIP